MDMKHVFSFWALSLSLVLEISCNDAPNNNSASKEPQPEKTIVQAPVFNAQQAYQYIVEQVAFGPRVPGTTAQKKCADWLIHNFKQRVDTVYVQQAKVSQPISNKTYPCYNIIGSINPQATDRLLILAHWDSRPWADEDSRDQNKPIDAADDGASGIAVMLAMADAMKNNKPNIGIDFLCVDVEDVGKSEWTDESYSLGTQYWARNPHVAGYKARWGICLDMVGAKGAQFPLEAFSKNYAPEIQKQIWDIANKLGYSSYFVYSDAGAITDDHVPVNEILHIPTVDIIHLQATGFGAHWHTHNDNIQIIDKATLQAVGQTVLQTIYENQ